MSFPLLTPEDVIRRLRERAPSDHVVDVERRLTPSTVYANERLFGLPVYAFGEGYKGQYLRHSYYDATPTERVWQIELGRVTIYGEMDGKVYSLFENGFPTAYVFTIPPDKFEGFWAEQMNTLDVIEVKESQIINLDRATQLKDSIIILDRFDLLRKTASRSLPEGIVKALQTLLKEPFRSLLSHEELTYIDELLKMNAGITLPSDVIDDLVEKNRIIESMQRAVWEYQRRIHDYETNMNIYRSENIKYYQLVSEYTHEFSRISVELTNAQKQLIRLKNDLEISMREAQTLEDAKKMLINALAIANQLTDELNKLNMVAITTAETVRQTSETYTEIVSKAKDVEYEKTLEKLKKEGKQIEATKGKEEKKGAGASVKKKEGAESE